MVLARVALVLGGFVAFLVSPMLILSQDLAGGFPQAQRSPGWLASQSTAMIESGLLDDVVPERRYDLYGDLYLVGWAVATVGLVLLVARIWRRMDTLHRIGWGTVLAGFMVVALGLVGDFAVRSEPAGGIGRSAEVAGFGVLVVGFALLGWALWRLETHHRLMAVGVAVMGAGLAIGGYVVLGHVPAGPGVGFALSAAVLGVVGLRGTGLEPLF